VSPARELFDRQPVRQGGLLAVLVLATFFFPKSTPLGVYGLGVTSGMALSLQAVAIVLVYRTNRIINFGQIAMGGVGAFLFQTSATFRPLLRWFGFLCGGTCDGGTSIAINYWFSLVVGLALPVGIGGLVYVAIIKRFSQMPRLLLTVATVFLVPALGMFYDLMIRYLSTPLERERLRIGGQGRTLLPVNGSFGFGGAIFRATDVIAVVLSLAIVAALFGFLRFRPTGVAIRATAENRDRAATLGINTGKVTSRIWLIAGGLSGIAAMLSAVAAEQPAAAIDLPALLVLLTAAAIAGLTSLPLTLLACAVLGIVQQSTLWAFGTTAPFRGALTVVLAITFFLQRGQASRGEIELASTFSAARQVRPVPAELRGLSAVRLWRRAIFITLVVVFLAAPLVFEPAQVDGAATYMLFGVIALSLVVLTGWAGQISLAQVGIAAVGAYAAGCSRLPFVIALVVGVLAGVVVSVLVGLPALRLRGLHVAIMSLSLAVSIQQLLIEPRYGGKALPADLSMPRIVGVDLGDARVFYYLCLGTVILVVAALSGLRRSRTARALLASRDNELAAQSLGVSLLRARLGAFAISGGIAALGGVLLGYQQHAVRIATFSPDAGLTVFQSAVVGGLGHLSGPLVGVTLLQGVPNVFRLQNIVARLLTGAGPLVIVLLVPGGLTQLAFDARDGFLRRLAKREGIRVPALMGPLDDLDEGIAPLLPLEEDEARVPARYRLDDQWALGLVAEQGVATGVLGE
jgi:branched-chain amino acid transport system permease protein